LLEEAAIWGAEDIAFLDTQNFESTPLLLMAAQAMAALKKDEAARKMVRRVIVDYPQNDQAYALLVKLGGDDLVALLDRSQANDRFEERPLIWKAKLQLDAGSLDDAEKTIRAAIAIDPSDGEQGKGDRMRAYVVLGDILEKKADAEQAKTMRGAVAAIRLSENADDFWNAGLLSRAVKMYEEALGLFSDAYCIQSRLALRYSEVGEYDKAEIHYRRAFELMPESFGRVESHCFGCEGAFKGKRAQNVADKVFTQLAQKMPDRAQVFYLLGYLRQQQGRHAEAASEFRKATTIDPDYLNAWKKLLDLNEHINMPAEERDAISLTLFRLDPVGRQSSPRLSELTNLRKLWDTILAAEQALPEVDRGPIFTLTASKAEIAKRPTGEGSHFSSRSFFSQRKEVRNHLIENRLIGAAGNLLEQLSRQR
jgi:tetratricopeptide (TPR) repeat protein